MVESLICPETGEWDIDFLKPFVSDREFYSILETHIGLLIKRGTTWSNSGTLGPFKEPTPKKPEVFHICFHPKFAVENGVESEEYTKNQVLYVKNLHAAIATMVNLFKR